MPTYAVTGASGPFGRHVIEQLVDAGVAPGDIVALARTPQKVADLAERGVQAREADYDVPVTLDAALVGVDRLLLVSGSEVGQRVRQHGNVITAAKRAGVGRIAYTSILRADSTPLLLAPEHQATEGLLAESGLPRTVLRNGWYLENFTAQIGSYLSQGCVLHAAGDGRIAAASRADFAAAAATALLEDRTDDVVYELGGTPFTYAELAEAISEVTGTPVVARAVTGEELVAALTGAGVDAGTAGFHAAVDANIAEGALDTDSDDLTRLLGRRPTSLVDAVRAAS
ncbi:MAG TPA: SDR family oxidoreductase [Intrasporangium sp.]|uniref:SDR family oxidoreductase n=1 Tax=Intrasporangium sp. TaxID=1925024 RepID=UPI002D77FFA2|nr:SDR family oxidoreductase [Intrasporangium sp.]HET7398166.1 SDR family oxidoreductase [Intrasporangium sp.]